MLIKVYYWLGEVCVVGVGVVADGMVQELVLVELECCCNELLVQNLFCVMVMDNGLWQIGFGELFVYFCGGMYVVVLGEIGQIWIELVWVKKGEVLVWYDVIG